MNAKTSAHYQREYRRRLRAQGLVKKEVWILPENSKLLSACERNLRVLRADGLTGRPVFELTGDTLDVLTGEMVMATEGLTWSTDSLYRALQNSPPVNQGNAELEWIDGVEPVLHMVMTDYGDLPLFITVRGEQILVDCLLWPASQVIDANAFNEAVLKTHKYFPLSTICLEASTSGDDCYFMFGALSHVSVLNSVLIEIDTLANNVLQATEAYSEYLRDDSARMEV